MKTIRHVVTDTIQNMLVWGEPNVPNPIVTDPNDDNYNLNKGLLKQGDTQLKYNRALPPTDKDDVKLYTPNDDFSTPLWRIYRRPSSPQIPRNDKLIPCAFLYNVRGVPDEEADADVGDNVESMMVGVDVLLDENFGAGELNDDGDYTKDPQELTDQINGVVDDLYRLLNPFHLCRADFSVIKDRGDEMALSNSEILFWESGVSDDIVQDALPYEIVRMILELTIEFPADLGAEGVTKDYM